MDFAFSLSKFEGKDKKERKGLCTEFLTNKDNFENENVEIKCQFSSSYRILRLPALQE